jgi:hypothetical protein
VKHGCVVTIDGERMSEPPRSPGKIVKATVA